MRGVDFTALSNGRQPGEENLASFFRKGMPGDWRNHFDPAANAEFIRIAGKWSNHFGYGADAL